MQIPVNRLTGLPIPMQKNAKVYNMGRSLLDNIYGASSDPSIQASPPSRFRPRMMVGYGQNQTGFSIPRIFTNTDRSQFVDPNIDNPLLRNYPQLRDQINNVYSRIPENQRKFVTVQDGKVVFDLPEEFEFGNPNTTTNQTENVPSEISQTGFASQGQELASQGLLSQQRKQPTTTSTSQDTSAKKRKGLLDQFKDFVKSDYGTDFAMGLLQQSGYSTMPQTLGQAIGMADEYATNKSLAREELDIKREAAKKSNVDKKDFAYIVKNPNDGSIYNAYQTDSGIVVDVNGKETPFRNNMFGGELQAEISTVGNLGDTNISGNAFIKIKSDLETTENQLQKIARYMENVDTAPQGMEKLATQFNTYIKTILADNDLNPQELKQAIISGEFQGLIGANRVEVVGGGVMTEQDAARIMLALGGDPANIATNPDVVIGLMSNIFAEKYNTYKDALETYNINVTSGGFTNYPKKELIKFNDNFLETINPQKLLELDLSDIPNFSKNQLFRLLRNNTDADGEVIEERFSDLEISQIIELAKKYNIEIDLGE